MVHCPEKKKNIYVHRREWEKHNGTIPKGMMVLHKCDNPPCYNIEHLFLGTAQENTDDMIVKGRSKARHLTPAEVSAIMWSKASERSLSTIFRVSRRRVHRIRAMRDKPELADNLPTESDTNQTRTVSMFLKSSDFSDLDRENPFVRMASNPACGSKEK